MVLDNYKGTVRSANKRVLLSDWAKEEVLWWLALDINVCRMSLRSIPVWESDRLATDAMDTAVGSVFRGKVMYEVLDDKVAKQTIAHKEWLAFSKTVLPILNVMRDKVITWHVDNMNVRQAWLNSGSVKDK